MSIKHSLPYRAVRYGFRLPGLLYTRYITQPLVDRWLKKSPLTLYVHDEKRGLLRPLTKAERLKWTMKEGLACDAVYWLDRVEPLLTKDDVIFDVGANIGTIANWFAERCKEVHAFEPYPENIETIREQNNLRRTENMILQPLALGKEKSVMQLHVKGFHGHHSLGDAANSPTIKKLEVQVSSIDSYCSENKIQKIDFLKIDVEGFEEDVLLGASELLATKKIGLILFEIREKILTSVSRKSSDVFTPLLNNGYQIISLDGNILSETEIANPKDGDYLAALDSEEVMAKLGDSNLEFI